MKPLKLLAAALSCMALSLPLSVWAHDAEHEKVTVLENHPMLNAPGKKAMALTVDYKPGQVSIPHSHSGSAIAYVLEGEVVSRVNDGKAITYKAGQTWYELRAPNTMSLVTPVKPSPPDCWCSSCWMTTAKC
jgi:quercetin dioxygenase-like cupin family protein